MNYWVIGFLWGSARVSGDYFLVQSMDKRNVEMIKEHVSPKSKVFSVIDKNKTKWRLKIPLNNEYVTWMMENNYSGRIGNEERDMPILNVEDEAEFLRGYFSVHHSLDLMKNTRKRLRFYAAEKILDRLNHHLHDQIDTSLKKIQHHNASSVCKTLYFQDQKEIPVILEYLGLA